MVAVKTQQRKQPRVPQKLQHVARFAFYLGVVLLIILLEVGWILSHADSLSKGVHLDKHYKVTGVPTIDGDFINEVLDFYNSPASGKGQALYTYGIQYGIDPVYALAFFLHESGFGTTGVARVTLSLGNIRATPGYENYDGYRKYKTWEDGFQDWYKLIKVQYIQKWQLLAIDQIVPVYAPSADHNDVAAYIRVIKSAVDTWRSGDIQV